MFYDDKGDFNPIKKRNLLNNAGKDLEPIPINSFEECMSKIYSFISEFKNENDIVFRGQSSRLHKLIPGAGRVPLTQDEEKAIFFEFKRNYQRFYPIKIDNDVDLLMLAQHYGLKTRLLDWSYNPLVSLYFASEHNEEEDTGLLYVKRLIRRHNLREGNVKDPFRIRYNTYLVPENFDIRFINQEGLFEIFPDPTLPSVDYHALYSIPSSVKDDIRNQLDIMGFNKLRVYPTLENLCENINTLFGKKPKL